MHIFIYTEFNVCVYVSLYLPSCMRFWVYVALNDFTLYYVCIDVAGGR